MALPETIELTDCWADFIVELGLLVTASHGENRRNCIINTVKFHFLHAAFFYVNCVNGLNV